MTSPVAVAGGGAVAEDFLEGPLGPFGEAGFVPLLLVVPFGEAPLDPLGEGPFDSSGDSEGDLKETLVLFLSVEAEGALAALGETPGEEDLATLALVATVTFSAVVGSDTVTSPPSMVATGCTVLDRFLVELLFFFSRFCSLSATPLGFTLASSDVTSLEEETPTPLAAGLGLGLGLRSALEGYRTARVAASWAAERGVGTSCSFPLEDFLAEGGAGAEDGASEAPPGAMDGALPLAERICSRMVSAPS